MTAEAAVPMQVRALGIDLGGTNLRVARVARDGALEARAIEPIGRDPAAVLDRLIDLCRERIDPAVTAIGLGVPGRVDARRRAVLSGGYLDLSGLAVAERLEQALGRPVVVDNDCGMALVAEMALGAARGCANVAMFTIGTGIGGALALDGRIVRGGATAGQLGHLTVEAGGLPCLCGRRGCVETTSSGTALGRLVTEAGFPAGTRAEALLAAAAAGDARAAGVLDRWAMPLRAAIDSIVAAVCPDLVLLGGGLGNIAAQALVRAPALTPWYQCPVRVAALGDAAGLIGAGIAALQGGRFGTADASPLAEAVR